MLVIASQKAIHDGNPSRLKIILADLTRIANELVCVNNTYHKEETLLQGASIGWICNDMLMLFYDIMSEKPSKRFLNPSNGLKHCLDAGIEKLEGLQRKLAVYILPTIEGVAAMARSLESRNARYNDKYITFAHLCTIAITVSRLATDALEAKSGSAEKKLMLTKVAIFTALTMLDLYKKFGTKLGAAHV